MVDTTNLNSLHVRRIGDVAEVGSPARVVSLTQNRSIASNPFMFTSLENANAYANAGQTATLSANFNQSDRTQCNTYVNSGQTSTAAPKKVSCIRLNHLCVDSAKPGEDLQALAEATSRLTFHPCTSCGACRQDSNLAESNWNWILLGLGCSGWDNCWVSLLVRSSTLLYLTI